MNYSEEFTAKNVDGLLASIKDSNGTWSRHEFDRSMERLKDVEMNRLHAENIALEKFIDELRTISSNPRGDCMAKFSILISQFNEDRDGE